MEEISNNKFLNFLNFNIKYEKGTLVLKLYL